jgi:hypothetical protein
VRSVDTARKTLNLAFAELAEANGHTEVKRQAAEKAWRAAREAVYAVMETAGVKVRGTLGAPAVGDFEARVLKRPRGLRNQPLTDGYARAQLVLHGDCFYDGVIPESLKAEMQLVEDLIAVAADDVGRLAKPSGSGRRKSRR